MAGQDSRSATTPPAERLAPTDARERASADATTATIGEPDPSAVTGPLDLTGLESETGFREVTRADIRREAAAAREHEGRVLALLRPAARPEPTVPRSVVAGRTVLLALTAVYTVWLPTIGAYVPPMASRTGQIAAVLAGLLLLRWSPRRGALPAVLLVAALGVWMGMTPVWTAWAPTTRLVARTQWVDVSNVLTALGCLALAGGGRDGALGVRRMWVAVLCTTAPVGVWEVLTHRHLVAPEFWKAPPFSPAATFGNPNNFAVVLTVGFGLAVCAASERMPWARRAAWLALAAVCGWLEWFTYSRGADLSCALLALVALGLWLRRSGVDVRRAVGRHRATATGVLAVAAGVVVAFFTVPALARINPVLRVLAPGDDVTSRSDALRVTLVRVALHEWESSPWTGIGAGHIALILRRRRAEFSNIASLHNGFVEFLAEYGIVVSALFVALLLVLAWRVLPRRSTRGHGAPARLDAAGGRAALAVYLVAFTQAGVVVASSVPWAVWWLLLASAAATGWWVGSHRDRGRHDGVTRPAAAMDGPRRTHVPRLVPPRS